MILTWTSQHYPKQLLSTARISRGQRPFRDHRQFGCCQHVLKDENLGVWMLLHASWTQRQKTVPHSFDLLVSMQPMCFLCLPERLSLVGVVEKMKHFAKLGFSENEVIIYTLCPSKMLHFPLSSTLSWCKTLSCLLTEFLREYQSAFPKCYNTRQPLKQPLGEEIEMLKLRQ